MTASAGPKSAPAPATEPRPIAVVRSYDDLRRALRTWCDHIGMTRADLDEQAGLADGHSGKLLAPRAVRRIRKCIARTSIGCNRADARAGYGCRRSV